MPKATMLMILCWASRRRRVVTLIQPRYRFERQMKKVLEELEIYLET